MIMLKYFKLVIKQIIKYKLFQYLKVGDQCRAAVTSLLACDVWRYQGCIFPHHKSSVKLIDTPTGDWRVKPAS